MEPRASRPHPSRRPTPAGPTAHFGPESHEKSAAPPDQSAFSTDPPYRGPPWFWSRFRPGSRPRNQLYVTCIVTFGADTRLTHSTSTPTSRPSSSASASAFTPTSTSRLFYSTAPTFRPGRPAAIAMGHVRCCRSNVGLESHGLRLRHANSCPYHVCGTTFSAGRSGDFVWG